MRLQLLDFDAGAQERIEHGTAIPISEQILEIGDNLLLEQLVEMAIKQVFQHAILPSGLKWKQQVSTLRAR